MSPDYEAGWRARGEFDREYDIMCSSPAMGRLMFVVGVLLTVMIPAIILTGPALPNSRQLVLPFGGAGLILALLGYLVNRWERLRYGLTKQEFWQKWRDKVPAKPAAASRVD